MSVLIRGVEMPTNCGYCPLRHEARDGDECYLGASLTEYQKRPDDCPLDPVSTPHGRLIDADEMIRDIKKAVAPTEYIKNRNSNMIYFLQHQETVIPADPAEEGE